MQVINRTFVVFFTIIILIPGGCSREESTSQIDMTATQESMRDITANIYQVAVTDPRRPVEDVARDAGRKPVSVLDYFGIKPGQRVVDFTSGIGYFTRIISLIVGSEGSVVAHNSGRRMNSNLINDQFKADLLEQYTSYGNVEVNYESVEEMSLPDNSVDVIFLSLALHHWHHSEESGDFVPQIALKRFDNIMRMLKPGGVFAIIDHEAADGMTRLASDAIHRIPRDVAVADLTLAGFILESESDVHVNYPEDDLTIRWTREPRDATKRIVQRYRKP
ncbi:MAG: class I SAM-dependent methyltransferase [Gammaproteobacteria bacterium]|jgi:predicted methyltransferase